MLGCRTSTAASCLPCQCHASSLRKQAQSSSTLAASPGPSRKLPSPTPWDASHWQLGVLNFSVSIRGNTARTSHFWKAPGCPEGDFLICGQEAQASCCICTVCPKHPSAGSFDSPMCLLGAPGRKVFPRLVMKVCLSELDLSEMCSIGWINLANVCFAK